MTRPRRTTGEETNVDAKRGRRSRRSRRRRRRRRRRSAARRLPKLAYSQQQCCLAAWRGHQKRAAEPYQPKTAPHFISKRAAGIYVRFSCTCLHKI